MHPKSTIYEQVMNIPLSKIQPNTGQIKGVPRNARYIKAQRAKDLKKSLEEDMEFMEYRELLVYPLGDIFVAIGGNMRLAALQELKEESAPCVIIDPKTPIKKVREIARKDNLYYGRFDWDALANNFEYQELKMGGIELYWDEQESVSQSLFEQKPAGEEKEKIKIPTIKIKLAPETSEADKIKIRTIIQEVISNYQGVTII